MPQPRARRSQRERSEETRARLLVATVDLMFDKGLAHTATNDVAEAAGVSRGALTHHFESREQLVASAIEHMLHGVIEQLKSFTDAFAAREGSSDEIIDYLWSMMSNRLFYVTLEFLPEARHNDLFRGRLLPVVSEWHGALDRIWTGLAARYQADPEKVRALMNGTLCLMRGMIAQTIVRDDPSYYRNLLEFWKTSVRTQLAGLPKTAGAVIVPLTERMR